MKLKALSALALTFAFAAGLQAQGTLVYQHRDAITSQAPGPAYTNVSPSAVAFRLTYFTNLATGVSIQLEGTADIAGAPDPSGWTALTAVTGTTSPAVGTTSGEANYCCDYYPWIRVNPTTLTGSGSFSLTATTLGYQGTSAAIQNGGGGGGTPGGASTAVQFNSSGAFGGNATNFQYISGTAAPAAPTVTVHGTPGTTTYGYKTAFAYPTGVSALSPETVINNGPDTLDGTNYDIVTAPACSGVNEVAYIFLATDGGPDHWPGFLGAVPCGTDFDHTVEDGYGLGNPVSGDTTAGLLVNGNIVASGAYLGNSPGCVNAECYSQNPYAPFGGPLNVSQAYTSSQQVGYAGAFPMDGIFLNFSNTSTVHNANYAIGEDLFITQLGGSNGTADDSETYGLFINTAIQDNGANAASTFALWAIKANAVYQATGASTGCAAPGEVIELPGGTAFPGCGIQSIYGYSAIFSGSMDSAVGINAGAGVSGAGTAYALYGVLVGDIVGGSLVNDAIRTGIGLLDWGDVEQSASKTLAQIVTENPGPGGHAYCKDCTVTSPADNTCVSSGSGAELFVIGSAYKCFQ